MIAARPADARFSGRDEPAGAALGELRVAALSNSTAMGGSRGGGRGTGRARSARAARISGPRRRPRSGGNRSGRRSELRTSAANRSITRCATSCSSASASRRDISSSRNRPLSGSSPMPARGPCACACEKQFAEHDRRSRPPPRRWAGTAGSSPHDSRRATRRRATAPARDRRARGGRCRGIRRRQRA